MKAIMTAEKERGKSPVEVLAVLNFGNSAWLIKRVPTDKLKED